MRLHSINNVPDYARNLAFWVVRIVDGALWFYSAWDDINKAEKAAVEADGAVFENEEVF